MGWDTDRASASVEPQICSFIMDVVRHGYFSGHGLCRDGPGSFGFLG